MEGHRVCVIDRSPVIRGTVAVVLGDRYDVLAVSPDEYLSDSSISHDADILIIGEDALPRAALLELPPALPVIWLQASQETTPPGDRGTVLPRVFTPEALRAQLHAVLTAAEQRRHVHRHAPTLGYPVFPREVVAVARRAGATDLPVLLCGEPGTGTVRLARAIHALRGASRFVALPARNASRQALVQAAGLARGSLTLLVQDISELSPDGQQLLQELLDAGGIGSDAGWRDIRLLSTTILPFDTLVQKIDRETFYRLSVLPLTLPPLRERPSDIPALVQHVARELVRSLGREQVTFTGRAIERLTQYLWVGNLAELETVLTRTIVLSGSPTIDADDLRFSHALRSRPSPGTPTPPAAESPAAAAPPKGVDLIINELAHEFKNPMVTIKAVAQHLERLLANDGEREQAVRLTEEAVDRMDRALENLLQFTRFAAPAADDVSLTAILAPCLSELTPTVTERKLSLQYQANDAPRVHVDPGQIRYALENLLRVIIRDLRDGDTLRIRTAEAPASVAFDFPSRQRSTARKLADMLDHEDNGDATAAPLGLVFAETMVARNGGRVHIARESAHTTITVFLPQTEGSAPADGTTTHSHS